MGSVVADGINSLFFSNVAFCSAVFLKCEVKHLYLKCSSGEKKICLLVSGGGCMDEKFVYPGGWGERIIWSRNEKGETKSTLSQLFQ